MRKTRWQALALMALVAAGGCGQTLSEAERGRVEQEVAVFVDSLFAAMNTNDPDAIAAHYDRSDAFTYVGCTSVRLGFESLERIMRGYYGSRPTVSFEHELVTTRVLDRDGAVATVTATTSDDTILYWTYVVSRTADGWRIVYEHESWADCPEQRPHPSLMGGEDG